MTEKEKLQAQIEVLDEIYVAGEELETFENLLLKISELSEKLRLNEY